MRALVARLTRFLGVGTLNTAATLLLYQVLVTFMDPQASYAVCWIVGVAIIASMYPRLVFGVHGATLRRRGAIVAAYLVVYFAAAVVLDLLTRQLAWSPRVAVLGAAAASAIASFLLMGLVLRPAGSDR